MTTARPLDDRSLLSSIVARLRAAGCVFAEDEAELLLATASSSSELENMLTRRVTGEPLEHVLGWAEFCGLRIAVEKGVFVPRRRTQFLADLAAQLLRARVLASAPTRDRAGSPRGRRIPPNSRLGVPQPLVVVDLCCGSGAVGAALLDARPDIELHATDVERAAVRCARRNLAPLGGHVHAGDLFGPLPPHLRGRVTLVVANAPYVPTDALALMPTEARDHEPRTALDGGRDGLDIQRRTIARAQGWLAPGGHLLVETSDQQSPQTLAYFEHAGLRASVAECYELGATVVVGERP